MRIKRGKEEWVALLREQKESGKSITEYCKEKGIQPNLFYRKAKMTNESGTFVKVPVPSTDYRSIKIRTGTVTVIVPWPFSNEDIIQVLQCVREVADA